MDDNEIREEAKIDLIAELERYLHPGPKLNEARIWGEDWIDKADVKSGETPKRLAQRAGLAWRAKHPTVTP